jgi:hypothetical protein
MSVVRQLEVLRGDEVEQAVQAVVVVPADVAHDDRFDVSQRAQRPGPQR